MMSRPVGLLALFLMAAAFAVPLRAEAPAGPGTEEEIIRQIKNDVFEEKWEAVLADCDRLIADHPNSPWMARTLSYRAKALSSLPGREQEAMDAWGLLIDRFPGETFLREDALISRLSLAKKLWLKGKKDSINVLMKALEETGYPRTYAAIQISQLDNRPARARALPVLKECSVQERDEEVRNECTLGILRIDPTALPAPPSAQSGPEAAAGGEPKLIRLEVREKATGKVTVAVNLPIAFAEALISSLSEIDQGMVLEELKKRSIDLDNIWKSLRTLGRQTLVQIETEDLNIRIWLD